MFTYQWQDVLTFIKSYSRNIPMDKVTLGVCDAISSKIWRAYPWKEALQTYPSILLEDGVTDYSSLPNFFRLVSAQCSMTAPGQEQYDPIDIVGYLGVPFPTSLPPRYIESMAFIKGLGLLRINVQPQVNTGEAFQIDGQYQPEYERIADPTVYLWCGDSMWPVVLEGALYWGYKLADKMNAAQEQEKKFEASILGAWLTENKGQNDILVPEVNLGVVPNWGG